MSAEHPIGLTRWVPDYGRTPRSTVQLLYATAATRFCAFLVCEEYRDDLPIERIQLRLAQLRGKRCKRLPKVPTDAVVAAVVAAVRSVAPGAGAAIWSGCGTSRRSRRCAARACASPRSSRCGAATSTASASARS